ncbi:MAG TPA: carboxypeptidase-like regulatory domain-containing protein, partial [Blastocatellia bacterium]|nr:carboxypeptidase-like regulatory domain-containing protein [Blastocatellia bacterium]
MKRLHRMKWLTSAAIFLLIATLAFPFMTPPVEAQATTGGLRGAVTDEKGGVISDAIVILRNEATGEEARSRSNDEGLYSFPSLKSGTYTMAVEKEGFKKGEFTGIVVNIGQVTTLDAALQPGLQSETVTVTAGEALIQREQVQISNTFESRKVAELPSNIAGGGIDTLALLAPGIVPGFGNVNSNGTTLSVNGNRARSNNFTVDGADNNDLSI